MNLVNIYNNRRQIYLFCRDDKGNLIIDKKDDFFPYFYELNPDGKFKTVNGESTKKIFVSEPSDVPKARSNNSYEADILFVKRYMIDRVKKLDKCSIKYALVDIEVLADELPNVQEAIYPISCISVYNSFTKEIKTWYLGDYGIGNENKMLKDFITYMQQEKFDLWLSWNVKFDYNYLFNRIEPMKLEFNKKGFPELISPIGKLRYGDGDVFYPAGISIVDYLLWDKKVTLNRRKSYKLDNVTQEEFKDTLNEKIEFGKLNPQIKEKNKRDIKRMVKLEEKLKYIDYFDEIRRLTKVEWEDMIWNSRIIDMLLLEEAKERKITLPMKPAEERGTLEDKPDTEDKGAHREAYEKGVFEKVAKYDIASAYPNMIKYFFLDSSNISLQEIENSTKIELYDKKQKYIGTYWFKNNPNAILPLTAIKLLKLKKLIKKEKEKNNTKDNKKRYNAIKTVVNSLFGVTWSRFFRLFDERIGETITFLVRDLLYYIEKELKKRDMQEIYVDTDGLMINNNTNDISNLLNELTNQWGKKYNKNNIEIEFNYEGYFKNLFIATKCRYEGDLVKPNGNIEFERKGLESKRKDSTIFMKNFQTELLKKIRYKESKENIFEWIKQQIKEIKNTPIQNISFPCRLAKKPSEYKNLPIFVRALNNTSGFKKKVGNNFYYIFVKPRGEQSIKTLIKVKPTIDISYAPIELDSNLSRKEGIEYARKQFNQPELESSRISVLHKKSKPKDVKAFDEENFEHIAKDIIDWDMMVKRNIYMKLEVVFSAMNWNLQEFLNETKI